MIDTYDWRKMKTGIILPTFLDDPEIAFQTAVDAEESGLDGVFVYDHMWPMGHPEKPALAASVILASLTQMTTTIKLGTLVSRVGLIPDNLLFSEMITLNRLCQNRLIAGLGTGDKKSADENLFLHIKQPSPRERQHSLTSIASRLSSVGVEVWIGAGLDSTNKIAVQIPAKLNFWNVDEETLREKIQSYLFPPKSYLSGSGIRSDLALEIPSNDNAENFTWAGPLLESAEEMTGFYGKLVEMNLAWAVFAVPYHNCNSLRESISLLSNLRHS